MISPEIASNPLLRVLARGASTSLIVRVAGVGLMLILHVVLARAMGPSQYGVYSFAISVATMLGIAAALGFDSSSVRFLPEYLGNDDPGAGAAFLEFSRTTTLRVAFVLAAALFAGALAYHYFGESPLSLGLVAASPIVMATAIVLVRQAELRSVKRIAQSQVFEQVFVPLALLGFVGAILMTSRSLAAPAVLGAQGGFLFLVVAILVYVGRPLLPGPPAPAVSGEQKRLWLSVSFPLMLASFAGVALSRVPVVALGLIRGSESVAIFSAPQKLALLVSFSLAAVNAILAPVASDLYWRGDLERLQAAVSIAARAAFGASCLIAIGLMSGGRFLLGLFGAEFTDGYAILLILVAGELVNVFAGSVGPLLTMTGNQNYYVRVLLAVAGVAVIITPLAVVIAGPLGAAVASFAVIISWNWILARAVLHRVRVIPYPFGTSND